MSLEHGSERESPRQFKHWNELLQRCTDSGRLMRPGAVPGPTVDVAGVRACQGTTGTRDTSSVGGATGPEPGRAQLGGRVARAAALERVEIRAVLGHHLDPLEAVLTHHVQQHPLAGLVAPERRVEVAAARDLLVVHAHDHVPVQQPGALPGTVGHQPRDDQPLLEGVGEHPDPRSARPARHAPEAEELGPVPRVVLHRDRQRLAPDALEVERHDAHDRAPEVEQGPAAEPRIRGARHDPTVKQVLPVRLELAQIGDEAPGDPPLRGTRRGDHENGRSERHLLGGREPGRGKSGRRHPQERKPALEILRGNLGVQAATVGHRDADPAGPHHHVVDREEQSAGLDHHRRPHALRPQDPRGGMRGSDPRGHVRGHRQERLDQADGGVHPVTPPGGEPAR